jgi:hypothetical protein
MRTGVPKNAKTAKTATLCFLGGLCDLRVHDIARLVVVTALAVSAMLNVGCGSGSSSTTTPPTPTQPADPSIPNLAGTWTGTIESAAFTTREISAQLVQTGVDCVDGAWRTTATELNGAISGFAQASSSFSGFLSVEGTPNGSGLCLGVVRVTGSATSTGIKWTWVNDGNCAGGIQQTVTFKLHK